VRAFVLTPEEIAGLDPRLNVDDVGGAAYEPDSGYADGYATTAAFAAAARRLGVEIWEMTPAEAILVERGRVHGVQTPRGTISTSAVLVAAGPWTPALLRPFGVDVPIRSTRHQIIHLAPPAAFGRLEIVFGDMVLGFYGRPETGGTVVAGMLEDEPEEVVPPDEFNPGVDFDFIERVGRLWRRRYPTAGDAQVRGGFASLYDVTPDWQPVLGAVEGISGLYIAAGFSGHGFKLSPALGEVLGALIAGESPPIDVSPFRLARFAAGASLRGRHAQGILG
jgi:glycine/D-amino acid oxidase-like deaminating enzyme